MDCNRRFFFFSSRRRHTRWNCDWSSDVCSSDLAEALEGPHALCSRDLEPFRTNHHHRTNCEDRAQLDGIRPPAWSKIGRASCRERVQITEVAVRLKEKTTTRKVKYRKEATMP